MKKLLIALLVAAPLLASASSIYKVTFENTRKSSVKINLDNGGKGKTQCMISLGDGPGESVFTLNPNDKKTITVETDNNLGRGCAGSNKGMTWALSDGGSIQLWHGKKGGGFLSIGSSWYTRISTNTSVLSATCDGKDCKNKYAKSTDDFNINIVLN